MLPSLFTTIEPGFEYWVYVAFDVGDPVYDNSTWRSKAMSWFAQRSKMLQRQSQVYLGVLGVLRDRLRISSDTVHL